MSDFSASLTLIALFILVSLLLYAVIIIRYVICWKKCPEYIPDRNKDTNRFSVIIPFRNEEKQLPGILHDLSVQDFPVDKTEIILVDDHSIDKSVGVIQDFCTRYNHFRLICLSDGESGKKEAIEAGIQAAEHEFIITTDADCRAGKQWLSTIASFCHDFSPVMVIGQVITELSERNLPDYFQYLESISLTGAGAASALCGKPIYCSGANLCYRRDCYKSIRDPMMKAVVSGDDTFLLLQMKKKYRRDIRVLKARQALITTRAERKLKDFLRQRSRWISKAAYYRDREIIVPALVVLLANLTMLFVTVLFITGILPWLSLVVWIIKLGLDGFLISSISGFYGIKFRPLYYLMAGFIYPFYLMIVITRAMLGPVEWKGRKGRVRGGEGGD